MRKIIIGFLLTGFIFCDFKLPVLSQTDTGDVATGIIIGAIEDSIIVDAARETSQLLKELGRAAKEAKAAKSVLPLVNSIRRNLKAIVRASQSLPLEKCQGSLDRSGQASEVLITRLTDLQEKLCSNVNGIARSYLDENNMYREGMCAKFLNDPVKFQQCEAKEHGGMSSPSSSMDSPTKKPNCLSDEIFAEKLQNCIDNFKRMEENFSRDDNNNEFPDVCENNENN